MLNGTTARRAPNDNLNYRHRLPPGSDLVKKAGTSRRKSTTSPIEDLPNARVSLVSAQHDRVVNSYQLLEGIGRLTLEFVSPSAQKYEPSVHYQQVRDLWWGTQTPSGK